jgi:hypothetical protein
MEKYRKIRNALEILRLNITNAQLELESLNSEIAKKIVKDLDKSLEKLRKEIESIESVK